MQVELTGEWGIVCVIVAVIVLLKVAKKALKYILLVGIIGAFLIGANIIELNTLPPEVQSKIDAVVETVGDSMIRTEGNSVLVKVDDEWYDVSKIAIIGDLATDSVVINYDGKELYVGETGLMNVLRVLEDVGLIQSE